MFLWPILQIRADTKEDSASRGHQSLSEWRVTPETCLQAVLLAISCNLVHFNSASALRVLPNAAGEHSEFLLCLAVRIAETFEKHETSKGRNTSFRY